MRILCLILCLAKNAVALHWNTDVKAGDFTSESHPTNDGTIRSENGQITYISANSWVLYKEGKLDIPLYRSPGHFREFLDCIKSRKRTLTPVEIAHCSQVPGHLGHIAAVTGRTLTWSMTKQEILGYAEAQAMTQPKMRGNWKV